MSLSILVAHSKYWLVGRSVGWKNMTFRSYISSPLINLPCGVLASSVRENSSFQQVLFFVKPRGSERREQSYLSDLSHGVSIGHEDIWERRLWLQRSLPPSPLVGSTKSDTGWSKRASGFFPTILSTNGVITASILIIHPANPDTPCNESSCEGALWNSKGGGETFSCLMYGCKVAEIVWLDRFCNPIVDQAGDPQEEYTWLVKQQWLLPHPSSLQTSF